MKTAADCFTKYETNSEGQTIESLPQFENTLEQGSFKYKLVGSYHNCNSSSDS